jgi:YD repeat-containing protein
VVYGATLAEVCAKRSQAEIIQFAPPPPDLIIIGWIPDGSPEGSCGMKWLINGILATSIGILPTKQPCPDAVSGGGANPNRPVPQGCIVNVPPPENGGPPEPCCGNPVNWGTGNKYQADTDLPPAYPGSLSLTRYYNTGLPTPLTQDFSGYWQHTYNRRIQQTALDKVVHYTPEGRVRTYRLVSGAWVAPADVPDVLTEIVVSGTRTGWRLFAANDDIINFTADGRMSSIQTRAGLTTTLTYSDGTGGANGGFVHDAQGNTTGEVLPHGLLIRVTDPFGRRLRIGYDNRYRIVKLIDPGGGVYLFAYGAHGTLTRATYPDGAQRHYLYNEPAHTGGANLFNNLTGIIDENGVRFATFAYDNQGRATKSTHHAGGNEVQRFTLAYSTGGQTTITDPLGTARPSTFQTSVGVVRPATQTQPSASGTSTALSAVTYDQNGNVISRTDFNGNRTDYTYDLARILETSRTEGLTSSGGTTPQTRTITTQWHSTFRLPTGIAEPLRITTLAYDADGTQCGARGALCSKSIQATTDASGSQAFSATPSGDPRTWTYTYNSNGDVLTVNGPRTDVSDVTTYTYYANDDADSGKRGRVATITNAAGHTTTITAYNLHGQPLSMTDANGLPTTMTYDARLRLKTRTVGSETTTYDYDFVGSLTKVTLPDGSFLSYSYDDAHRLTGMQDNLGNRIAYTLDAAGNRTQEEVFDPSNQLAQTRSRVYNNLNRLFRELGAQNQTTEYMYDEQGNTVSVKDPLNRVTTNQYDALNRLRQVTSPAPISAVTQYGYNGLDALTQVTDPRGLITGYAVDGLGNLNVQTSPDTGQTTNTYDAAGNLLTQSDAKNQLTTYAYDALNRVTLITFHDGSKQEYAYDQGSSGIGRLSSITEKNPANQVTSAIAYAYDQHGRVTSETRTVAGVQHVLAYRYDSSGRLDQLTYPSGRTVNYAFDGLGRVSAVTTTKPGEQAQNVVTNVAYHPFGGVKAYTLGNGQAYTRGIDLDGRIASYTLGNQAFAIGYDAASRIEFISQVANPPNSNSYGYDALDRLTSAVVPGTPYAYTYDAVGNRTSRTAGASTEAYTYSPTSNRIATVGSRSFVFDANGSTTNDGLNSYAYDVRGRMVQATSSIGATDYQVNALGQRIRKTNSLGDTVFHYDTRGRLIAETGPGGALKRELIYLGDIPVGVVQ